MEQAHVDVGMRAKGSNPPQTQLSNSSNNRAAAAALISSALLAAATPLPVDIIMSPTPVTARSTAVNGFPAAAAAAVSAMAGASTAAIPSPTPAPAPSASAAAAAAASSSSSSSLLPTTLLLPSLSTGDYQFLPEKACPIAERAIRSFLHSYTDPTVRIVLLLPVDSSGALTRASKEVQAYFDSHPMDERFSVRTGDVSHFSLSELGLPTAAASVLVHATTYRFQGGEGGALNRYLPSDFAIRMHRQYGPAMAGKVYQSAVQPGGELEQRCPGVRFLLSLRPPCMNEARPDALHGDYLKGCRDLRDSYDAVLHSFAELAKLQRAGDAPVGLVSPSPVPPAVTASSSAAAAASSAAALGSTFAHPISVASSQSVVSILQPSAAANGASAVSVAAASSAGDGGGGSTAGGCSIPPALAVSFLPPSLHPSCLPSPFWRPSEVRRSFLQPPLCLCEAASSTRAATIRVLGRRG